MDIHEWDERYRSSQDLDSVPTPLLVESVSQLTPGKALDLAVPEALSSSEAEHEEESPA